ncbi:hypothetical protein BOH72_11185 [Mycobacterium sp. WY10]|nr:hypothetical protein BOH72_11185 [Mycobacterium sp. WY10]
MTNNERRLSIFERAAKNVDWEAVEAMRQREAERRKVERIAQLRHIVFRNAARGNRSVTALTRESAAAELLIRASKSADGFLVLAIVQVAVDRRWGQVVKAGARYFGEHPVAERIQELWNLTTDRPAV